MSPNPSLIGLLDALRGGESLQDLMALRDQTYGDPVRWMEGGWIALAELLPSDPAVDGLLASMRSAWGALTIDQRQTWTARAEAGRVGAQSLWREPDERVEGDGRVSEAEGNVP